MTDINWGQMGENVLNTTLAVWAAREGAKINAGTDYGQAQQAQMMQPEVDTATGYEQSQPYNSASAPLPWYRRRMVIGLGLVGGGALAYYLVKGRK